MVLGDLATEAEACRVAEESLGALGSVDILVNNAAIYANHGWLDATADDWAHLFNANVFSVVRLIRLLLPPMKAAGWGRIVNIASGEATQPLARMPDYGASKAALVNMTVSLAKELAGTGVTVHTVSPGIVVTDEIERFFRALAAQRGWGTEWSAIETAVLREWRPPAWSPTWPARWRTS